MKIRNKKSKLTRVSLSKSLTVAFLLSVVSFAYITNISCVCDMSACSESDIQISFDSHNNGHSDHSTSDHHSENMNMKGHHHPSNSQDDGCCSDSDDCTCDQAAFTLLSDLPKLLLTPTNLKVKNFNSSVPVTNDLFITQDFFYEQESTSLNDPPPKIRDIRIFIQSYLI